MITAAANRGWPDDVAIDDYTGVGQPIPSVVRTAKIATIAALEAQSLGVLPEPATARTAHILRRRLRGWNRRSRSPSWRLVAKRQLVTSPGFF